MIEVNKCLQFICATLYYILLLFDFNQLTSTTIINMFLFFLGVAPWLLVSTKIIPLDIAG